MPSDNHENILHRLSLTADRVMEALRRMDFGALETLSQEHSALMRDLEAAGPITNRALEPQLRMLLNRVQDVNAATETRRHEIAASLKQIADGRKMLHAYGA